MPLLPCYYADALYAAAADAAAARLFSDIAASRLMPCYIAAMRSRHTPLRHAAAIIYFASHCHCLIS